MKYNPPTPTGKDERCGSCAGTGQFVTRIENGRPVGSGTCFRCGGKGFQTDADRNRNYWYDVKYRKIYW